MTHPFPGSQPPHLISAWKLRGQGVQHASAEGVQDVQPQLRPDGPQGGPGRPRVPHL